MTRHPARSQQGIALITVVVVLVALAVIATPFALSMRSLESSALLGFEQAAARADAELAMAAARHALENTHPMFDLDTPWVDRPDELLPPDLAQQAPGLLPRDSTGTIASIDVEDESGKVHLGTASPYLLGNLLGGRSTLTADIDERSDVLPVASTDGFGPSGLLWVGEELVEYSGRARAAFEEVRRGHPSANLLSSRSLPHRVGDDVLDYRLLLLAQHGWRIRPGIFDGFRRVEGLKDIGLYGEMTYTAAELDRVRPFLSVHAGGLGWGNAQRVLARSTARSGGIELVVEDGSGYGAGTVVQLTGSGGEIEWNLVLSAVDWKDEGWHLLLAEVPSGAHSDGASVLRALVRAPVNIATCSPRVLAALLTGLGRQPVGDVITVGEAGVLVDGLLEAELVTDPRVLRAMVEAALEAGRISMQDLNAALRVVVAMGLRPGQRTRDELVALLVGTESRRASQRISGRTAEQLTHRIRAAAPGSLEELRAVIDTAVMEGTLLPGQRDVLLRNAVDSNDAELVGGTAPFSFHSAGIFRLSAAVSRNLPNGKEQSRVHMRELVSVAPGGESARSFATQRDFDEAARATHGARGWTSFPEPLLFGRPSAELPGGGQPSRAGALLSGGHAPSAEREVSFLTPTPVRSALPDTRHFDEGLAGLTGSSPRGWDFADGAVTLPLAELEPPIRSVDGLLGAFAVEFWFELSDVTEETILFDGGANEIEDRVLILVSKGELILRVDDTGIPDFQAVMPEGRAPPAGEIRYAFDDGLTLLPGVPYHVLAQIGGARDRDLLLFVDGVPRGQRSFTTWLTEDVGAGSGQAAGAVGFARELRLKVDSTAGFPERGALRVGQEVMEYAQKTEDAFLVRSASAGDPFGGRGRRGTFGGDHPASELVELVGWVRLLASERASRGNGTLPSPLSKWGVAELDPTALTSLIEVEVTPTTFGVLPLVIPLGTGLSATEGIFPVRPTGNLPLDPNTFQPSGGHAILICDYGGSDLVGKDTATPVSSGGILPSRTLNGELGGVEVIRYTGFDGVRLTGVQRNQAGIPVAVGGSGSDLVTGAAINTTTGGDGSFLLPREFVTTFDAGITGALPNLPATARVLVLPISVGVSGGNLYEDYHPAPRGSFTVRSALAQIGLDFTTAGESSEWVRWNTSTSSMLVRDDLDAINNTLNVVIQREVWNPDLMTPDQGLLDQMATQLKFRGQDGTTDSTHTGGSQVLPTIALGGWFVETIQQPEVGIPGRHDAVTLIDPFTGEKEWHRINHASSTDTEWSNPYVLVGLRSPVVGEYLRADFYGEEGKIPTETAGLGFDELFDEDSAAKGIMESLNVDTRLYTRMLCSPSGELPTASFANLNLGQDYSGRRSPGGAIIDELRLHVPNTPGPLISATGRYVLAEDLEYEEDTSLRLHTEELLFPHTRTRNPVLGADALEILSELPQQGGLLLLGEEIVGYAGIDPVDSGAVYLTARGLYGTARAYHRGGEAVTPLLFWPASPLAGALDASSGELRLADASGFPDADGLVWVGEELIGITGRRGDTLSMPTRAGSHRFASEGLMRGRFGTEPVPHELGEMVRWMPARYRDRALLGDDVPESECMQFSIAAPGAFFTELMLSGFFPDPSVGVELRAVLDGLVSPHADPAGTQNLAVLTDEGGAPGLDTRLTLPLMRQADRLDLYLYARWRAGAFDALDFSALGWKLAPEVNSVIVGHDQPTLVFEHEEWR
jgi:hypothetical protein